MRAWVDIKRQEAVELFDTNITDIIQTLKDSTDYLFTLSTIYKEKLANTKVII